MTLSDNKETTMNKQDQASVIIDALGGTTKVAALMDAPKSTVHSWRSIGIPRSRMAHLALIAKVEKVVLP